MQLLISIRKLSKLVNTIEKRIYASIFLIGILAIASIAGYFINADTLSVYLTGDNRSIYMLILSSLFNTSTMTLMYFVVFTILIPQNNIYYFNLKNLQVKEVDINITYFLTILTCTFLCIFITITTLNIPAYIANKVSVRIILLFYILNITQYLFILCILFIMYSFLNYLFRKFTFKFSLTQISIIVLSVMYIFKNIDFANMLENYMEFNYNINYLVAPFFTLFCDLGVKIDVNYIYIFIAIITVLCLLNITFHLKYISFESDNIVILKNMKMSNKSKNNIFIKELKLFFRSEQILLNYLILIIMPIFVKFNELYLAIYISLIPTLIPFAGIYSFGFELKYLSMYKSMNMNFKELIRVKYLSGIGISCIIYILVLLLIGINNIDLYNFINSTITLISMYSICYLAGIINPIDMNEPFSGAISFLLIWGIYLPIILLSQYIFTIPENIIIVINLIICIVCNILRDKIIKIKVMK